MIVNKVSKDHEDYPKHLRTIPSPPNELFYLGVAPGEWDERPKVAIVGSRGTTAYGKAVTAKLARELAENGVTIISGLALGVDAIAHTAALEVGGGHIAVLPAGLMNIYPATNRSLAQKLLEKGGCILSEYEDATPSFKANFIARNRIVSGMADVLLITEAAEKSGTLHTANFALQQGKEVLVVPGNITSPNSVGTNNLIKAGAVPVTCVEDILERLHIQSYVKGKHRERSNDPAEQKILDALYNDVSDGHELLTNTGLTLDEFTMALTMLEIQGKIHPLGNNHWSAR